MIVPAFNLPKRAEAAQATLDKYMGKVFQYGRYDCVRLCAFNLRQLGYMPKLFKAGAYTSPVTARAALRQYGFSSLEETLDDMKFPRIPPAAAVPADIIALPGTDGWCALTVAVGNGRLLGFHEEDQGCCIIEPLQSPGAYLAAWRCDPVI